MEELEKDEFLQQIHAPSFSVQNHVTTLLTSTTVNLSAQISALTQSLAKIDQAIHVQVTTNHGDLLAQTSNVEVMDGVVLSCQGRAKQCLELVDRLRLQMDTYEEELSNEITALERLLTLRSLLRRSQRVVSLENIPNLTAAKQAQVVTEIEYLCGGPDPILKNHLDKANGLRRNIKKQTENMLSQGLGAKSSNQISSSLQIFINLNSLDEIIGKTFGELEKNVLKDLNAAFTLKTLVPSAVTKGPPGRAASLSQSVSNQGSQIWSNLETLASKIIFSSSKIKLLWLVLQTHRDCDSNIYYCKFLNDENTFWNQFWAALVSAFEKQFRTNSEVIKTTFESEYPKLLKFVCSLTDAIEDKSQPTDISPAIVKLGLGQSFRSAIASFEKAYLSRTLSKLFDHVNHVFVSGFPNESHIDELVTLFKSTLDITPDEQLKKQLSRNVSKTVHLFSVRCEGLVIVDGGATQVIGPPTPSQQTNVKIINLLEYFKLKLKELSSSLPSEDLESISVLQYNTIWSLINGIADAIEAIVLTMHQEQWARSNRTTEYSLYIGELQAFIARASKDYLNFQSLELIQKSTSHLSSRTIDLLTRHASILPMVYSVRSQIITDLTQLEIALSAFTPVLSDLGKSYKLLKGFKTLLNVDPKEIEESNLIPVVVPASLALNYLLTISDDELLKTPQAVKGWSAVRYSRWLDDKTETERVNFIKSALNDYVKNVSSTGRQEYNWVYPIMLGVVKRVT
ncbi:unnamed protein product [Allacma fusca]|uniref:Conserved oligomeric Golgi complex subunit 5 n=1 Tax=Allacma fusca TaxID=39272 RepID=A0A8J2KZH1_9HEXA|nr:unnamed protein product [Allacma fusca]